MVVLRDLKGRFVKGSNAHNKGYKMPETTRKAILKSRIGSHHNKKTKQTISEKLKNNYNNGYIHPMLNKKHSDNTRRKMRNSRLIYMKEHLNFSGPCIGKREKPILDYLENIWGYTILRQHNVDNFFLDGYCPMLKLAIEIDEHYHNKKEQLKKDVYKENYVKNKLKCNFLRLDIGEMI